MKNYLDVNQSDAPYYIAAAVIGGSALVLVGTLVKSVIDIAKD